MRYTIITPTLLRKTLARLCRSIEQQSCTDWQHIVVVDTLGIDQELIDSIRHPQRLILFCEKAHEDWAVTCRRSAWEHAQGDYLLYVDDDNWLADDDVLEALQCVSRPVALHPLLYRGEYSDPVPVRIGHSDTNQLMVRRDIGQWPLLSPENGRQGDGIFIRDLTLTYPYDVYTERALVVYEEEGYGK